MSTLLIGGNGFVGSNLIKYLCKKNKKVISYSSSYPKEKNSQCKYYIGDVTEYGTLDMIMKKHKIKRVIHNAAVSHPKLYNENPYKIYRVNVLGTMTALEAARTNGIKRFVYMSSSAVYGDTNLDIITENTTRRGENPYGATKIACEELVRNYGLESASLRIGFIYGPGRKYECPINMLISDAIKKRNVKWDHGLEQRLDYIYINDCIKAIIKIVFADTIKHSEYNVGGGELVPFSRIVKIIKEIFKDTDISIGDGTLGYDNLGALSINRIYEDYGWEPEYSIKEGIKEYVKWIKQN